MKNRSLLTIFMALTTMLFAGCITGGGKAASPTFSTITADEARQLMKTEKGFIIVDVRTPGEYTEGHIPNAINIPNESIGSEAPKELANKAQTIFVYCRSGARSREASEKLSRLGYTNIINFGGIKDWTGEVTK